MYLSTCFLGLPVRDAVAWPSGIGDSFFAAVEWTSVSPGRPRESISCRHFSGVSPKGSLNSGSGVRLTHALGLGQGESASGLAGIEQGGEDDFELQIFEDFKSKCSTDERIRSDEEKSVSKTRATEADWAVKARERAVEAIRERGLPVGSVLGEATKKKKKRRKSKRKLPVEFRMTRSQLERLEGRVSDAGGAESARLATDAKPPLVDSPWMKRSGSREGFGGLSHNGMKWSDSSSPVRDDATLADKKECRFSGNTPSARTASFTGARSHPVSSRQKRQEDFDLNRKLVSAANADDVLTIVGKVMGNEEVWGLGEIPLSSFNISTALHRIAKHMEATTMSKGDRLAFARKKLMVRLVSAAVESLRQSSPQSISNITWAVSKVGGPSLYWTEMDALAEAAISNIAELQPQHMANIAGAFACMQHSVPRLFDALDSRASTVHRDFRPQELAQLLWAFAALNQAATRLVDSLDLECHEEGVMRTADTVESPDSLAVLRICNDDTETSEQKWESGTGQISNTIQSSAGVSMEDFFGRSSLSELASISWSYTVLNLLRRPSFALIWRSILRHGLGTRSRVENLPNPRLQLSQLHQTKVGLQLDFPDLDLSFGEPLESLAREQWEQIKSGLKNTSVAQLDVERLLASMGQRWVTEYSALDYSVDAALVERKIGLEIDGPTHFARNTGMPLGHTVVKRRHLAAAGWTVLSIPYVEWDEQEGEQEQRQYLTDLLRDHL